MWNSQRRRLHGAFAVREAQSDRSRPLRPSVCEIPSAASQHCVGHLTSRTEIPCEFGLMPNLHSLATPSEIRTMVQDARCTCVRLARGHLDCDPLGLLPPRAGISVRQEIEVRTPSAAREKTCCVSPRGTEHEAG